ncbi:MAG: DUF3108 domain-containing protein [Acidobacteriota bacterium]|nr:DUF3108 domain-containing protein [Acidobacteriota bacterium]
MHRRQPAWLTLIFSILVLASCLSVFAQSKNDLSASGISGAPYRVGEKLTYSISFATFATAAHAETFVASRSTLAGRESIELRARVETVGLVSVALFAINNEYVAYVDPRTGLPFRTRLIKLAKPLPDAAFGDTTSPAALPAIADVMGEPIAVTEGTPTTYDLLSALYRLRALPLAPGASFRFTAQQDGKLYETELKVTGRETIQTSAGSFNTYATQLRVRNNSANDYGIRIYFSEDERHLPVLITAQHTAGEVRAVLASSEIVDSAPPVAITAQPPPAATPTPRPLPAAPPTAAAQLLAGLPFNVGEELNFNFYLGTSTQPIGVANFQVRPRATYFNRDGILLSANMYTTDVGQRLFPVNDRIDSYVDARTLLPYRTQLRILEGSHRMEGVVTFDQERGSAVTTDGKTIEIPVGTYELASVLYAMRSFDLTPPKRNAVSLLINKRPRTLFITALNREVIELGGERIPAVQLSLMTDEAQGDRLGLRLWMSTDRRRLPLRITANTPLGPVRADLSILPLTRQ